jgi:hypothetical protein
MTRKNDFLARYGSSAHISKMIEHGNVSSVMIADNNGRLTPEHVAAIENHWHPDIKAYAKFRKTSELPGSKIKLTLHRKRDETDEGTDEEDGWTMEAYSHKTKTPQYLGYIQVPDEYVDHHTFGSDSYVRESHAPKGLRDHLIKHMESYLSDVHGRPMKHDPKVGWAE